MLVSANVLSKVAPALRQDRMDLLDYMDELCKRLDQWEGQVQSLVPEAGRTARLTEEAAALLKRYPRPQGRPALFGVLLGVKDCIKVEGFPTRAGSRLPPELFAGREAACVAKFRAQGAIVLGKTVTTEFTLGHPGPTRNPHNLEHTPGGSSSGSAAAVAAGFCPLAVGTQTGGSVIRPAAYCGVVGFKPTYGRINAEGIIHYSRSLDHIGLFTQDVPGMILAASIACHGWQETDGDPGSGNKPVLGIPEGPYMDPVPPETLAAFEDTVSRLEDAGYRIAKVPLLTDVEAIFARRRELAMGELAQEHKEWFREYRDRYSHYAAERIQRGREVSAETLGKRQSELAAYRKKVDDEIREAGIDLVIAPSAPGPAPQGLASTGSSIMNQPWTYTGHPVVTLPAGLSQKEKLPLGIQIIARHMQDERLLGFAAGMAEVLG